MRARYLVAAMLIATPSFAQTPNVDWKFVGRGSSGGSSLCFYDEIGIERKSGGHIRVWLKCLPQKDLQAIDIETAFDGAILHESGRRLADNYVPPIGRLRNLNHDQTLSITVYEVAADIAPIKPEAQIFYELNCSERMMRELSVQLASGGSTDNPSDWHHIPPETNGATLLALLCPSP